MDWQKIEQLIDKYFEGTTSLEEEMVLKNYFSQENVADELKQFQPLFSYLQLAKEETAPNKTVLKSKKPFKKWISIAAVFILIASLTTIWNLKATDSQDLGTFDDPEIAYAETLKALELLASNVNYGMESVNYINEYEYSKNLIFKN
ncbi:hypothetical protein [Flavobacterium orientale]|uniref:Anti-sigma factor n=1 Tax=Flavobacterium orientale TaxID=1756020 RepID=A0A916Y3R6_9FLAO|nr:hypothetical protein [Flavobacterium orientale]GGD29605.1 hypothetical protein GCM10011343_19740 [Flavobacterium orientale]